MSWRQSNSTVIAAGRRNEAAVQFVDQFGIDVCCKEPYGFGLDGTPDQHVFEHVRYANQGYRGSALRQDVDQPFGREPGQGLRNREARDAEPLADEALVENFAGAEGESDDSRAQHVRDMLGDATPPRKRRALKKMIGTGVRFHANMLVGWREHFNRSCLLPG